MTTTMMMTFPLARLVFSQQPCIIHCSFLDGQDLFHLATLFRIALCAVRAIEQNFPNKSRDIVLPYCCSGSGYSLFRSLFAHHGPFHGAVIKIFAAAAAAAAFGR